MNRRLTIEVDCEDELCGHCRYRAYGGFMSGYWCQLFWCQKNLAARCEPCLEAEKGIYPSKKYRFDKEWVPF